MCGTHPRFPLNGTKKSLTTLLFRQFYFISFGLAVSVRLESRRTLVRQRNATGRLWGRKIIKKETEKKREKSETISPATVEYLIYTAGFLVECCFPSTETVGLLGTGAQDVHLDFHTDHELCGFLSQMEYLIFTCFPSLGGVSYLHGFSVSVEYLIYTNFPSQWSILFSRVFRLN